MPNKQVDKFQKIEMFGQNRNPGIGKNLIPLILLFTNILMGYSQEDINYDEAKVPDYQLPKLLITEEGGVITSAEEWMKIRRPEILFLFEEHMYGKIPGTIELSSWEVLERSEMVLEGKALRKQVLLKFEKNKKELQVNLLIFVPKNGKKVPIFLGYNFFGNHTITDDPEVIIPNAWSRNSEKFKIYNHHPVEESRGSASSRWPIEKIIDAGYGLATMFYGEVDPDKYGDVEIDFSDGVHPLLFKENQTMPLPNQWGAISAWAWGLSRALDYLEKDPDVDHQKVAVYGFSRLGKAALWAGARDQRFALVISNNSGSGGAALSRRKFGERLEHMSFTPWFSQNLSKYYRNEDALPIDQHMLIALIAPRPVYIASAEEDHWADPKGEYLSAFHAGAVYELFGKSGFRSVKAPEANRPIMETTGYHLRDGGHDITDYDWEQFIRFFDLHF